MVYVPKFHFLGAKMQFLIDIAISNGRFDTRNPLEGDHVIKGAVGISNTSFVPFDLGWNLKWLDFQAGVSVYAPTGRSSSRCRQPKFRLLDRRTPGRRYHLPEQEQVDPGQRLYLLRF